MHLTKSETMYSMNVCVCKCIFWYKICLGLQINCRKAFLTNALRVHWIDDMQLISTAHDTNIYTIDESIPSQNAH